MIQTAKIISENILLFFSIQTQIKQTDALSLKDINMNKVFKNFQTK